MPTYARWRRSDNTPLHLHPTLRNPEGRWHGPWERHVHQGMPDHAHTEHDAEHPRWQTYPTLNQTLAYARGLAGEVLENRAERRARAGSAVNDRLVPISVEERRFGVEIECCTNPSQLMNAMRAHGLDVAVEGYNHETRPHWKLVHDGSVSYRGRQANLAPWELVSPILQGTAGMSALELACTSLREVGTIVNRTCGLHVHHDAADLTVPTAKVLAHNYVNAQKAIDKLVAASRRTENFARWCQPLNRWDLDRIDNAVSLRDAAIHLDRYRTLNLNAYARHGTVEFRQHQGTIEFPKISAWVQLGQRLVDASLKGIVVPETAELAPVFEAIELPDPLKTYFTHRARELN